ncbi:MAG TPA: hypothetical protein VHT75_00040 [Acidimicrobiales bacterium]|nr:hypothetical protein [Acidimicrobiales bacterium]
MRASLAVADQIPVPLPPPAGGGGSVLPPSTLPPLPPLPPGGSNPGGPSPSPCASASASACPGGTGASDTRIATLSYSQGLQLATAGHDEMGVPNQYLLPILLGLTLLLTGGGLGLQLWAGLRARRVIRREP